MKKNCNIVKDLLPLYIDNVCSEESRTLIDEHLKSCKDCKKELDNIKTDIDISKQQDVNEFKKFKNKINFKIMMIVIICCTIISAIIYGGQWLYNGYKFSIKYDENFHLRINGKKNRWNFQFQSPHLGNAYADIVKINENGEEVNLVFLTWKSSIRGYFMEGGGTAPDMDYGSINIDKDKMRVYYTTEDLKKIKNATSEELNDIINNSLYIFNNDKRTTNMKCSLDNKDYEYTITYYDQGGQILESDGDNTIPTKINIYEKDIIKEFNELWWTYENAHEVLDKIEKHVNDNGGNCTRKDIEKE